MKERVLLGNNAQFIRQPFAEFVKAQKEMGIEAVDLTLQTPHFYVDSYGYHDLAKVKGQLDEAGIKVHSVVPLPYRYAICADGDSIQGEKTIAYYKQCILLAEDLGAKYLSITGSGANYDDEPSKLMANAKATLKVLAEFAGQHGVTLLLGSVVGEECPYNATTPVLVAMEEVKEVIDAVSSEHLKAYLDTEVISLCGETITGWFQAMGNDIRMVRFVDGNYNGYRLWGKGCFPGKKYLAEIQKVGYQGAFALTIPGERYMENPAQAVKENLQTLRQMMEQV